MPLSRLIAASACAFACVTSAALAQTAPISLEELRRPNVVVVLRHANAPGVGDPRGMRLGDCKTQRNLDERGRRQAGIVGDGFRAAGVRPTQVLSSAWCRCLETARLMNVGPVQVQPLLNSFFEADAAARAEQTAQLSRLIDSLDARGGPYLMVTHQVVISALTGHGADSGGGVAIELPAAGQPRRVRVLPATGLD